MATPSPKAGRIAPGHADSHFAALPSLQLQSLWYFLVLCEERHFTRAAQRCGIAQPSLTNAIKRLEALFGGSLFERPRSAMDRAAPTQFAVALRPSLRAAHAAVTRAWHLARERGGTP